MTTIPPDDLAELNSGRYVSFTAQETGTGSTNGTPTAGSSGVDVGSTQKTKLVVVPNGGATLTFRIWAEFKGLSEFAVIDGYESVSSSTSWTQELNTSGMQRLYVQVIGIDTGSFDVQMGLAELSTGTIEEVGTFGYQALDTGLGTTQSQRMLFAWRKQEKIVKRSGTYPQHFNPSNGDSVKLFDYTGRQCPQTDTYQMSWDGSEGVPETQGASGVGFESVKGEWNQYITGDPFAILIRLSFTTLPSNNGSSFNPIFQSRNAVYGVSWNVGDTDSGFRFRPKLGSSTDVLDNLDFSTPTFDMQPHDFIVSGDGQTLRAWYDDQLVGTSNFINTEDSDLDQISYLLTGIGGSPETFAQCHGFIFDRKFWDSTDVSNARSWVDGQDWSQ
jgi:hypothetical protein